MTELSKDTLSELIKKDPGESASAYTGFLFWASLPPSERANAKSLAKTSQHCGLGEVTLKEYRVQFKWDERANLIDAYHFQLGFERRNELSKESDAKFVQENREIQNEAIKVSRKALALASHIADKAMIANEFKETDWVLAKQPDGTHKSVPTKTIIHMKESASDVAQLLRAGIDTPLKAMGLPTEVIQHKISGAIGDKPVLDLSDDELAEKRRKIAQEKNKIIEEGTIG